MTKKIKRFSDLLTAILLANFAGILGSYATMSGIDSWYSFLQKPFLNPPGWIFGPVWTLLYVLMGIASFLIYEKAWKKEAGRKALKIYVFQLILNSLWSIIFFGLQQPFFAFMELIILWLAILWTILSFYKISKAAAYLLLPYIAWVSFAAYLNLSIAILN